MKLLLASWQTRVRDRADSEHAQAPVGAIAVWLLVALPSIGISLVPAGEVGCLVGSDEVLKAADAAMYAAKPPAAASTAATSVTAHSRRRREALQAPQAHQTP